MAAVVESTATLACPCGRVATFKATYAGPRPPLVADIAGRAGWTWDGETVLCPGCTRSKAAAWVRKRGGPSIYDP